MRFDELRRLQPKMCSFHQRPQIAQTFLLVDFWTSTKSSTMDPNAIRFMDLALPPKHEESLFRQICQKNPSAPPTNSTTHSHHHQKPPNLIHQASDGTVFDPITLKTLASLLRSENLSEHSLKKGCASNLATLAAHGKCDQSTISLFLKHSNSSEQVPSVTNGYLSRPQDKFHLLTAKKIPEVALCLRNLVGLP